MLILKATQCAKYFPLSLLWNKYHHFQIFKGKEGFPGGAVVENLPANAEDTGLSPGLGRSHMPRSN